jgi:hypothetical protein
VKIRNDEVDTDVDPSFDMPVGSATPLHEYNKPRREKRRRRPIGFLRDDWPDIVE